MKVDDLLGLLQRPAWLAGAAVLPSKTSLDENGQTIKRAIQGKGEPDVRQSFHSKEVP